YLQLQAIKTNKPREDPMKKQMYVGALALTAALVLVACGGQSEDSLNSPDFGASVKSTTVPQNNADRLAANGNFAVAVNNVGQVYTWGDNSQHELIGTTSASNSDFAL